MLVQVLTFLWAVKITSSFSNILAQNFLGMTNEQQNLIPRPFDGNGDVLSSITQFELFSLLQQWLKPVVECTCGNCVLDSLRNLTHNVSRHQYFPLRLCGSAIEFCQSLDNATEEIYKLLKTESSRQNFDPSEFFCSALTKQKQGEREKARTFLAELKLLATKLFHRSSADIRNHVILQVFQAWHTHFERLYRCINDNKYRCSQSPSASHNNSGSRQTLEERWFLSSGCSLRGRQKSYDSRNSFRQRPSSRSRTPTRSIRQERRVRCPRFALVVTAKAVILVVTMNNCRNCKNCRCSRHQELPVNNWINWFHSFLFFAEGFLVPLLVKKQWQTIQSLKFNRFFWRQMLQNSSNQFSSIQM